MVALALLAIALFMLAGAFGCGYLACRDKCLFHRLCAMNHAGACFACFCEIIATICRGFSEV